MSRRRTGRALPAKTRMRRWRAAQRAKGLKATVIWTIPPERTPAPSLEQRLYEARSLILCLAAAQKIDRNPALLDLVHENFERWQERDRCAPARRPCSAC